MKNALRDKMKNGEKTIGTFFELGSGTAAECLGLSGLDYIIIDNEHGCFHPQTDLDYIRTAKQYGLTPIVRVQEISRPAILKPLDVGAMGLLIPCVKTVEDAEKIVEYGKYAPIGDRGVAPGPGSGYWYEEYAQKGLENYFTVSNRETLLIPQCETAECLADLEKIVAIEGIDAIFVGPFDLSTSLGIPGQFDREDFKQSLRHIAEVCHMAGKPCIIYAGSPEDAKEKFAMGYDSVAYGMDSIALIEAFRSIRSKVLG